MNCKCACTNTLDYCEQDVCDEINFNVQAVTPGEHTLKLDYLNTQVKIVKEFSIGEDISFPLSDLNENFQYTGEIIDPVGAKITINKDGVVYDCFKFTTVIGITHSHIITS